MSAALGQEQRSGLIASLCAYTLWGLLPIFFHWLHAVEPTEVVAQRILWSLLLILLVMAARTDFAPFLAALRDWKILLPLTISALLIAMNWLTYIWAVHAGHILGASLGYFLNPLVNVLLGVLVLKERLRRGQAVAVAIAAVGVALMAMAALDTLWVSIALALTFAFYGLVRKLTPVPAFAGLGAETLILSPFALGWCLWLATQGSLMFGTSAGLTGLLILSGALTTVPLVLFAIGAQRLPLSALGLLQYIAPTLQFLTATILFGEKLNQGQLVSFALIWLGLILFAWDSYGAARRSRLAAAAA